MGGIIQTESEQKEARKHLIEEYNLQSDSVIFMHSGKLNVEKKTVDLLRAFKDVKAKNAYMFIFGSIPKDNDDLILKCIENDKRVFFLGWKSGEDIIDLLNAADVYCQPGTPSASSQVALCCGCAEIVAPILSYKVMYGDRVLYAGNEERIRERLLRLVDRAKLMKFKNRGYEWAIDKLDYRMLAERYLK